MGIKAVFFDIDNTLYDSARLSSKARRNSVLAMIDAGLDKPFEEVLDDLQEIIEEYGSNYPYHYDTLLDRYGLKDPMKIIAAGVVAYEHTKIGYLKPFPGVVPALMRLYQHYGLGVISNGVPIKQWEKLVGLGLHHFFKVLVTSGECGHEKPEPEIFQLALERMDILPDEAVMIGDKRDCDMEGAMAAGIKGILFVRGEAKSLNEINSFSHLPDILKRI